MLTGQLVKKFLLKCKCTVYQREENNETQFEFLMCHYHNDQQRYCPMRFEQTTKELIEEAKNENY